MMLVAAGLAGVSGCEDGSPLGLETGTLVVRVLLDAGVGLAGAEVLMSFSEEGVGEAQRNRVTDASGTVRLDDAEEGTWEVTVTFPPGFEVAPGHPHPASAQVVDGRTTTIDILAVER